MLNTAIFLCVFGLLSGEVPSVNNVCVYMGQTYYEGQTWRDGCSHECRCVNGEIGFYTCYKMCVESKFPSVCRMMPPPPGECCPRLWCPQDK